jgi:NAD+ kinase
MSGTRKRAAQAAPAHQAPGRDRAPAAKAAGKAARGKGRKPAHPAAEGNPGHEAYAYPHPEGLVHGHTPPPDPGPIALHDSHITYPEKDVRSIAAVAFSGNMAPALDLLARWAEENPSIQIYTNEYLKPFAREAIKAKPDAFLRSKVDLILSLGGDGTFLSAARMMRGAATPILGVNLGRVGFLADVTLDNLHRILDEILRREYSYRRRMLLEVEVFKGNECLLDDISLNDVAFTGQMGHQMVDLRVTAQGRFLTDYWVDGLLVSTPTGSTAYALSAGGPIIHPSADSLLLTPMNPTSLSVRPLVLPDYMQISVRSNLGRGEEVNMFVDGRNQFKLRPEHTVLIRKHKEGVRLVRPKGSSYFESLRSKLGWTGSRRSRDAAGTP